MSNLTFAASISSHADAVAFLGSKDSRKLCYETLVRRGSEGAVQVEHHGTVIAIFGSDGTRFYNNGGYHSKTTRDRLHRLTPGDIHVRQHKGAQIVSSYENGERREDEFARHFTITRDGSVVTDLQQM